MLARLIETFKCAEGTRPIVCGEGVSYINAKFLLWEEHSEKYRALVKEGLRKYKEAGL